MAGKYDFGVEQGVEFTRVITWNGSDNQPVDLTGLTARMELLDADGSRVQALSGLIAFEGSSDIRWGEARRVRFGG